MGALLPGLTWAAAGWSTCIAMAMLAIMAAIAGLAYRRVAA